MKMFIEVKAKCAFEYLISKKKQVKNFLKGYDLQSIVQDEGTRILR